VAPITPKISYTYIYTEVLQSLARWAGQWFISTLQRGGGNCSDLDTVTVGGREKLVTVSPPSGRMRLYGRSPPEYGLRLVFGTYCGRTYSRTHLASPDEITVGSLG